MLEKHIEIAKRDLIRATGVTVAADTQLEEWQEALIVRALSSVFPWLNTFALEGAAKVGRIEGSVEYRFLDPEEVEAKIKNLNDRFEELVAIITPAEPAQPEDDQVTAGGIWMTSI